MAIPADLLIADVDRIFQDWGDPAQFEEVARIYDPDSGRLNEAVVSTEIMVVCGADHPRPLADMAASLSMIDKLFLVRQRDLPTASSSLGGRIRLAGIAYEIRARRPAALSGVVVLECVTDQMVPEE